MEHRGASGSEPDSGDGAGILVQVPDAFFRAPSTVDAPRRRPLRRGHGVPADRPGRAGRRPEPSSRSPPRRACDVLGWRDLPVDPEGAGIGATARARHAGVPAGVPRRRRPTTSRRTRSSAGPTSTAQAASTSTRRRRYFPSLSARTSSTRGCSRPGSSSRSSPTCPTSGSPARSPGAQPVLDQHVPELAARAPVPLHRAQRRDQHRRGNRNWMRAREALLRGPFELPDDLSRLFPICTPGRVATATVRRGPRAAAHGRPLAAARRADDGPGGVGERRRHGPGAGATFYAFHSASMEPWDGPALRRPSPTAPHRRRARPQRSAARRAGGTPRTAGSCSRSEVGVLDIPGDRSSRKGRLQPGKMFLVDTAEGRDRRRRGDQGRAGRRAPVRRVAARRLIAARRPAGPRARRLHARVGAAPPADLRLHRGGAARSCSRRWRGGAEPIGSMGTDTPDRRARRAAAAAVRLLQPAVRAGHQPAAGRDPRGARHLARRHASGPSGTCSTPRPASCRQVVLPFPVIDNDELAKIVHINDDGDLPGFSAVTRPRPLPGRRRRRRAARRARPGLRARSSAAIADGARIIVLSDRDSDADWRRSRRCC